MKKLLTLVLALASFSSLISQPVPGETQNIPFFVTCGSESEDGGDDDHSQTIFVSIPEDGPNEFFIRVYDPDCGGKHDIPSKTFNTRTRFEIFGGEGCLSSEAARETAPVGDYRKGTLLLDKTFENQPEFDGKYTSLGPIMKNEGEYFDEEGIYAFKLLVEARDGGDDCNLYRLFISEEKNKNIEIAGCFAFMYEQCFILPNDPDLESHLYPAIPEDASFFHINNYDFDNDGEIKIIGPEGRTWSVEISGDQNWENSQMYIEEIKGEGFLDICMTKSKERSCKNNIVVVNTRYRTGDNPRYFTIPSYNHMKNDGDP